MLFLDISNSDDQNDFPLNDAADITPHVIADMEEKLRKLLNMQHLAAVEVRHIRSPQESKPTGLWRIAKVAILILIQHFLVSANKTAKQDTVSVWEETLPAFNTVDEVWEFAVRSAGDEREANLAMEFRRAISNDQLLPAIPNEKSPKPDWSRDPLSAISEDNTASSPTISETMIDVFRQEYPLTLSKLQHCHRLGDGEMSDDHDDQDHTHTLSAELDRYISEAQTAESLLAQFQSLRSQHLLPPSSNNTKALGSQSEAAKAASPYRKKNSEEQFIGKMRKSEHGQEHKPDVPARCATMPTSGPLSSSLSSLEKVHSNIHAETLRIMRFRDDDDRQRREQKVDVKRER
ncbi:Hypothetical predicted protein [Lecanosticta acicola]|uniref:Uncharacterized protein n=1 Tax=Lecanosticta acicola TaxID=111012 RepID=A0AAI8Z9B6_9PEZI|nr:Hypothetical predicted protein [Lecanosticta acicola]